MKKSIFESYFEGASFSSGEVKFPGISLAHDQLSLKALQIAGRMKVLNIGPGDRIVLCLHNGLEYLACHLACQYLGAVSILVNPQDKLTDISKCLENGKVKSLIVGTREGLNHFKNIVEGPVFSSNKILKNCHDLYEGPIEALSGCYAHEPDDLAMIIFTSGSMGIKKAVCLSQESIFITASNTIPTYDYKKSDLELIYLPLQHGFGINQIHALIHNKHSVYIPENLLSLSSFFEVLDKERVTCISMIPSILNLLTHKYIDVLKSIKDLRFILLGAESVRRQAIEKLLKQIPSLNIYSFYGLTEAPRSTSCRLNDFLGQKEFSIGKALPGISVNLKASKEDTDGEGEIAIQGAHIMLGYMHEIDSKENGSSKTNEILSGDLGLKNSNGNFYLRPRKDDFFKKSGFKVYPIEIENIVQEKLSEVFNCAAVWVDLENSHQQGQIYLLIQMLDDQPFVKNKIKEVCNSFLTSYKQPKKYYQVSNIPLTANNKIDRKKCRALVMELLEPKIDTKNKFSLPDHGRSLSKPRQSGLTLAIDNGLPNGLLKDYFESCGDYIDTIKLGWGTSVITPMLKQKLELCKSFDIPVYFGGTLFEIAYINDQVEEYLDWLEECGVTYMEVSDGSVSMSKEVKLDFIRRISKRFQVFSEYGSKDEKKSSPPAHWVQSIKAELEAGATKVIAEGRESGNVGLYQENGEVRTGLVQELMESGIPFNNLIFEAPIKHQQVWFIENYGVETNFGNIALNDVIGLETFRRGLRGDTIFLQSS
jgi:phosphosulfolactate synthase